MASVTCRNPVAPSAKSSPETSTYETMVERVSKRVDDACSHQMTPHLVASTLKDLCEMGLVEKFRDEYGITRYRPTNGRVV